MISRNNILDPGVVSWNEDEIIEKNGVVIVEGGKLFRETFGGVSSRFDRVYEPRVYLLVEIHMTTVYGWRKLASTRRSIPPWPLVVYGLVIRLTRPSPLCTDTKERERERELRRNNKVSLKASLSILALAFFSFFSYLYVYIYVYWVYSASIIASSDSRKWEYTSWEDYLFGRKTDRVGNLPGNKSPARPINRG